ncbi:TPA: hypothetical protein HA351_01370 [Methanosarcinaceae archaeon]|nr:hypothetical protein [Methanosarcinaceae archaeon]
MKADLQNFEITAHNIGGLTGIHLNIKEGLNVIEAPNASGKTSLLRAFLLSVVPVGKSGDYSYILHSGSNYGFVEVKDAKGRTFKREISRIPKGVQIRGDRLLDEKLEPLVRRFAIGGNNNEVLVAVRSGQNMKQILLEYTNIDLLRAELNKLEEQKRKLLTDKEALERKLTDTSQVQSTLEAKSAELEALNARYLEIRGKQKELQAKDSISREYEHTTQLIGETMGLISRLESSISSIKPRLSMLELDSENYSRKLDAAEMEKQGSPDSISSSIAALSEEKNQCRSQIDTLNHFIDEIEKQLKFPSRLLMDSEETSGSIIERTFFDETIMCPFCGQASQKSALDKHRTQLINLRKKQLKNIHQIELKISGLKEKEEELKKLDKDIREYKQCISSTHLELASLKTRLAQTTTQLKAAEGKKGRLESLGLELESKIETMSSEVTKQFSSVNQAIGRLEIEISNIEKKLRTKLKFREELEKTSKELESAEEQITSLRQEIRSQEENIRENFNMILGEVYAQLKFKNVDAITLDPDFELKVSRTSREGAGYFDRESIKTLSTSELEVVGLVVMLSGYITYKVMEFYPAIILDELTFLDFQRLNSLIEYISKKIKSVILTTLSGEKIADEVQRYRLKAQPQEDIIRG